MDNKKHIVAITALIKNLNGDKFLILKRSENEIAYPSKWSFPGGKLEKGENILQTLKREIKEEVGLDIEDYKEYLKDYTFIRPDGHNVIGFAFLVKAKNENVLLGEDFQDFKWVKPDELKVYDYILGMEEEVKLAFQ
ncbi:NUDIX domain-containing protein [Candidatus Woesearchaeota archaeon]|nr:NUDIX domain-containing protein [Candidatus Woesearchaeota archaeon]